MQKNQRTITALGLLAAFTLLVVYYCSEWQAVQGFVEAADHCDQPLTDYVLHYLPMGREFFETESPVSGFFYSAFFALVLVPFGWLSDHDAIVSWGDSRFFAS